MIYFKACPKCRGDIQLQNDGTGDALHCFQCGFERAVAPHLLAKGPRNAPSACRVTSWLDRAVWPACGTI